jgi:hypothetical protein
MQWDFPSQKNDWAVISRSAYTLVNSANTSFLFQKRHCGRRQQQTWSSQAERREVKITYWGEYIFPDKKLYATVLYSDRFLSTLLMFVIRCVDGWLRTKQSLLNSTIVETNIIFGPCQQYNRAHTSIRSVLIILNAALPIFERIFLLAYSSPQLIVGFAACNPLMEWCDHVFNSILVCCLQVSCSARYDNWLHTRINKS